MAQVRPLKRPLLFQPARLRAGVGG